MLAPPPMTTIWCICCSRCLFLTSRHEQEVYQRCLAPHTLLMHSESCCDEAIRSESPCGKDGWVGCLHQDHGLGISSCIHARTHRMATMKKRAWLCPCVTVPTDSVTPKRLYKAYLNKPK